MEPDVKIFIEKLLKQYDEMCVTDKVFCFLQSDKELMHEYLILLDKYKRKGVNPVLGKEIKQHFKLNSFKQNQKPRSVLIQSFTELDDK